MTSSAAQIKINGVMNLIKKSKHPLAAVYEAFTNSLEASYVKNYDEEFAPEISLNFYYAGLDQQHRELDRVEIVDNGIGFDDENLNRFKNLLDNSKGFNNRGSGRIQYLHIAGKVIVESVFVKNGKYFNRKFLFNKTNFVSNEEVKGLEGNHHTGTKIIFENFNFSKSEKQFFDKMDLNEIKSDLKAKFLLRFYLDSSKTERTPPKISFKFFLNEKLTLSASLTHEDISVPVEQGFIEIPFSKVIRRAEDVVFEIVPSEKAQLKWAHFKVSENELEKNGVYLCSKDIAVLDVQSKFLKKNEVVNGKRSLTAIYGDVLDDPLNVTDTVDGFKFPRKKDIEASKNDLFFEDGEHLLLYDNIEEEIKKTLPKIYGDVIELHEEKEKNVDAIAIKHGIPIDIARSAKIGLNDSEQVITEKIFLAHSEILATESWEIAKLYESLSDLNPLEDDYEQKLEEKSVELLTRIPQQNKEELSRYIIRREMVSNILRLMLDNNLAYQKSSAPEGGKKDKEGLIHDLIFKRKSKESSLNDLWILNEEFVHFDGCSDVPLDQIKLGDGTPLIKTLSKETINEFGLKPARRPDIFLFPAEGKCILIELKEPDSDLTDHLNQVTKYANFIANFSNLKIEKFFCYLIGENIKRIDLPLGDYEMTVNGDWLRNSLSIKSILPGEEEKTIANASIEIIKLSSISSRAHRRNKSFADKLGIRPETLEQAARHAADIAKKS